MTPQARTVLNRAWRALALVAKSALPNIVARYVVHAAINHHFLIRMFIGKDLRVSGDEFWLGGYASNRGIQIAVLHDTSLVEWPGPPVKIMIRGPRESLESFGTQVMGSQFADNPRLLRSHPDSLEVWPSQIGKFQDLAKMSSRVVSSNIVAIGDGEADVDTLRWAG